MKPFISRLGLAVLVMLAALPIAAHAQTQKNKTCRGVFIRHAEFLPVANGYRFRIAVDAATLPPGTAQAPQTLRLRLDGTPLYGPAPKASPAEPDVFQFLFQRADADNSGYQDVRKQVTFWGEGPKAALTLSAPAKGTAGEQATSLPVCSQSLSLGLVHSPVAFVVCALFLLAALVVFIWLAIKTDIVRDRNPLTLVRNERRPYSLSRCQMAFWFFVVLASYLFVLTVTFDFNNILNAQSLILIGISSATWMAAATVDTHQSPDGTPWPVHESFLTDLLTDRTGVTLHRFQILVLTLLLGAIYLVSVGTNLLLPTFDPQLLGLMGISSGVYVGLKIPEKQT